MVYLINSKLKGGKMIPKYYPNPTALDSFDKALGCNYYKMKEFYVKTINNT